MRRLKTRVTALCEWSTLTQVLTIAAAVTNLWLSAASLVLFARPIYVSRVRIFTAKKAMR